jgi:hypothetical protein
MLDDQPPKLRFVDEITFDDERGLVVAQSVAALLLGWLACRMSEIRARSRPSHEVSKLRLSLGGLRSTH